MFQDRQEAGRRLARRLIFFRTENPLVLAVPRGGIVVGYEVAVALRAPLDVLVVRRLAIPTHPEAAFGALAPDGVRWLDGAAVHEHDLTADEVDALTAREAHELRRWNERYRGDRPAPAVTGRTVILVDDGVVTGAKARAAAFWLRDRRPRRLVLAVPFVPHEVIESLRREVDLLVTIHVPDVFQGLAAEYREFDEVAEETVAALLKLASRWSPESTEVHRGE